jgi:hypothetical protein
MLHQARRTVHSIGNHLRRAMHGFDLRRAINTGIETGVNAARAIDGGVQALRPWYERLRPVLEKYGVSTHGAQKALGNYDEIRNALMQ